MQNVWILDRWLFTGRPSKGCFKLFPALLRFDQFRKLLVRAVEYFYLPPCRSGVRLTSIRASRSSNNDE